MLEMQSDRAMKYDSKAATLIHPTHLFSAPEVLDKPPPVPKSPGVYAWYFDEVPPRVPTEGCHQVRGHTLLYVGIAPKAPPTSGKKASSTNLHQRIRYHLSGNAYGSTLRLTLGCLLADRLGIHLQRVGSGNTRTFTNPGEQRLDAWMADHARVVWIATEEPWKLEEELIGKLNLPLNLAGNKRHPFCAVLSALRASSVAAALALPIAPRGGPRRVLNAAAVSPSMTQDA